jgi:general secretion pathway protein D
MKRFGKPTGACFIPAIILGVMTIVLSGHLASAQNPKAPATESGAPAAKAAQPQSNRPDQFVSIDFNSVDINVFIKFMSELTGTNFVVDPRVRGKVTIISPSKISMDEAYKVFESVLEVNGYTTVNAGEVVKIIPAPDARSKDIETMLRERAAAAVDKIVTQLVPLKYADANEIKRLFTPMISKSSVILAYDPTNTLIITDVYSNIKRLLKILSAIDIPGIGQEISVIPLEFADSTKLVNLLSTIFKPTAKTAKGTPEKAITMVADERTNTIVMLANEVDTFRAKRLVEMIDKEAPRGKGRINVYYLEHANAEELAKVLQEVPSGQTGGAQGKPAIPLPLSEKVKITADKATNSLIIMADKEDYMVLEEVIKKLDIPRSMVYIESLIMEVDMEKSLDLGINWQTFGQITIDGKQTAVGGGFSQGLINPSTVPGLFAPGLSVGVLSEPVEIAGLTVSNIAAIINAVKTDNDVRILSTPQILTTDNEEARITVGENRPYQTQVQTSVSGDTFNSFEYRDVGKILKITPHVTEGRLVRLTISLEVTSIDLAATISTSSTLPVTKKRTVDTTVLVKDNHTVVIGGLIDDTDSVNETKVPVLGDVPLLGFLFRSKSTGRVKTNLYIFLTPRVIQNPGEADQVYGTKKEEMDTIEQGEIKLYKGGP